MTDEPYHIESNVDAVDILKPLTAFLFTVGGTTQAAAAFVAVAADVGGGTLSNGELVIANGSALPAVLFGGLGGWSGFPADIDRIYFAPLSVVETTVYAHSLFNA